jgi:hypothetical protein
MLFHTLLAHRWASLGIKLASVARRHTDLTATINEILSGKYIEAAVSLIYLPRVSSELLHSPLSLVPSFFSLVPPSFYTSRLSKVLVRLRPPLSWLASV